MKDESFRGLPSHPKELMKAFVGSEVTLLYKSGMWEENVKIEGVIGNIVVATKCGEYLFLDLPCICGIKVNCENVIGNILSAGRGKVENRK